MVGSSRSWGTRENNFRGREKTRRKQNPGKVGLPSKSCAGAWEKRLSKQALLFSSLEVSLDKHLTKRGSWGPEMQRDQSSKESKHLLIQLLVSHWDTLRGLITSVGSQWSLLQTGFHRQAGVVLSAELPRLQSLPWDGSGTGRAGQLQGDLSKKDHGDVLSPIQEGLGTASLHPALAGPSAQHRIVARTGILCPGLHPVAPSSPFLGSIPQPLGRKASVGINPEAACAQRWVREHV